MLQSISISMLQYIEILPKNVLFIRSVVRYGRNIDNNTTSLKYVDQVRQNSTVDYATYSYKTCISLSFNFKKGDVNFLQRLPSYSL